MPYFLTRTGVGPPNTGLQYKRGIACRISAAALYSHIVRDPGYKKGMATPSTRSLGKALELLSQVARDGGKRSISVLAAEAGIPASTAYRIAATFERSGFMTRLRRGHYLPGPTLLRLADASSFKRVLVGVGRPIVEALAKATGCTAHLGVFEDGMVTYLLKAGRAKDKLFTRQGTQLEAYCTGIGKVLLAALPESALEDYLANGPFIRLTANTLTDPRALRAALTEVQVKGYATDNAEMDSDLICLAVPVRDSDGKVLAAFSISIRQANGNPNNLRVHLDSLRAAADALTKRLTPHSAEAQHARSRTR